jgi:hypothetical protein
MIAEQNLCVQCYEPITNPVCEACHLKEVAIWLEDTGLDGITKSLVLAGIRHSIPEEAMNETNCILCGENTLSTCSYCFFLATARVLRKLNIREDLMESFLETFNYRLGHSEYTL